MKKKSTTSSAMTKNIKNLIISAKKGDVEAQRELGNIYHDTKEYEKGFYWYMKAAENGDQDSQYEIGHFYEYGHWVGQCYYEAAKWYEKAAAGTLIMYQGDLLAKKLGQMYFHFDHEKSFHWYMNAAKNNNCAFSQYEVGYMYEHGYGVEQSLHKAIKWYKKSAKNGDEAAKEVLKENRLQTALRRYEENQRKKSNPLKHYNYPYNAGYGLNFICDTNTEKLFETVSNAPRSGLSKELIETPYDRITDKRIPKRIEGFSVSISRSDINKSLSQFTSTNTSDLKGKKLSETAILTEKGFGDRYSPDIPYNEKKPLILAQIFH